MTDEVFNIQNKEKPQICAIDLDREIVEALQAKGLHCFDATLGSQIEIREYDDDTVYRCELNCDFPPNLHEYDILIVDLQEREPIEYILSEHTKSGFKGSSQKILLSKYPQTIFGPRPLSSSILGGNLYDFLAKETLTIIFCSTEEISTYYSTDISYTNTYYKENQPIDKSLYHFMSTLPAKYNKKGKNIVVSEINKNLTIFLNKYKKKFIYEIVFQHPRQWSEDEGKLMPRKDFIPLLLNCSNEIVGFIDFSLGASVVLAFPQLQDRKKEFLLELIDEILPGLFPKIFPYSEQFSWLKLENYFLPNQAAIIARKTILEDEYKAALSEIEEELQENTAKYKFIHDLITETGEALVKSVEKFFTWLGFENVVNMDETNPKIKEEDIQINLEEGLLVIEIKGIGGTSKDSECEQIGKIKNRRAKERNSFDVFGLYIVNHQRYLPPHERKNPPFNQQQIDDAQLDERGLLTTYELFKLYFYIKEGFITKEDARSSLWTTYGLVKFKPSRSTQLGYPLELYYSGQVVILNISNIPVKENASIIVCNDEDWFRAKILKIELEGEKIEAVSEGEIGVELNRSVLKTSELWLENTN